MIITLSLAVSTAAERLTAVNDAVFRSINGLAGHSRIFDMLVDLPLTSNLAKAAVIGACFLFAWHKGGEIAEIARRRRVLLITLAACVFVIATTKVLSKTVFLPRPFVLSQTTYRLEGERLVENPRLEYNVPLDDENQKTYKALVRGEIAQNDLGSFPSDHAGFYMTLAVGILLACRSAGLLALGWTILVTLGSRVISGAHSPLDIAAGSGIGVGILFFTQYVFEQWGRKVTDFAVDWTLRNAALASAIIFVFIYEASNTLENTRFILKTAKDIVKAAIGG